jgi:hypothetical protein
MFPSSVILWSVFSWLSSSTSKSSKSSASTVLPLLSTGSDPWFTEASLQVRKILL